jgi:hypothetical protein
VQTDEEEGGSVDMVGGTEPAAGVLEKVRDVLRKESEKQEVGDEFVLLKADSNKPQPQGECSNRHAMSFLSLLFIFWCVYKNLVVYHLLC